MGLSMLFFLALVSLCSASVVHLTEDDFDSVVDGSNSVMVEFFAPWCGHCKTLAPEYAKAANAFKKFSSVVLADVDCTANGELCKRFGVKGYPTVKWFGKGEEEPIAYEQQRTAEGIVSFINAQAGVSAFLKVAPTAVKKLTKSNFKSIVMDETKNVLVEFYAPWCGHCKQLAPTYETLATIFAKEDNVVIASVDADAHPDFNADYDVKGFPTLIFFPAEDKAGFSKYEGDRSIEALTNFINSKCDTMRTASGGLSEMAGRVEELDDIIFQLDADNGEDILQDLKTVANVVEDKRIAKFYVHFLTKHLADPNYIANEIERLQKMLAGKSLSAAKRDEFSIRVNILKSFPSSNEEEEEN